MDSTGHSGTNNGSILSVNLTVPNLKLDGVVYQMSEIFNYIVFVLRSIISGSCSMLESARALALAPTERAHWQLLAQHSKTVSDSIKALVTNIK